LFPGRHLGGPHAGELYWVALRHDSVLFTLHNPRYAGAYFYGRQHQVSDVEGRHRTVLKPREEWTVLIPGAHDGYITFERFEANQAALTANAAAHGRERRAGPAREGPALLQGLVVCGKCGERMTVGYHRRGDASLVPNYACQREGIATGTPSCQRVHGSGVDAAVAALVLEQLTPLAIEAAFQVSAELTNRAGEAERIRLSGIERARYGADAARRRYLAVDPVNRLVADTLEADWNHKLRELADEQDNYERTRDAAAVPLDEEHQVRIRALATDLPALWADPGTPMRERKRLIRLLVTDVTLRKSDQHITAHVRLSGGATHTIVVPRPLNGWESRTTPQTTIAVIDELLAEHPFDEAVTILNERGLTGGWGGPFTTPSLAQLCRNRGIADLRQRLRSAGMLSVREIAVELGVSAPTIKTWRRQGLLTGRRTDGRGAYLYHPGQTRPSQLRSRPTTVTAPCNNESMSTIRTTNDRSSIGGAV
jgi:hypothetical protein